MSQSWESIVAELKSEAGLMHVARESGLQLCRQIIQLSSRSIRCAHRRQFPEAEALLIDAKALSAEARAKMQPYGPIFYAGFLHDAEKELVEAASVLCILQNLPYPSPSELGVGMATYLNGIAEAASEVRRYALDEMRRGNVASAEGILNHMETIYDDLISFDFPDSMTGGLRRTCDALRAVVERTRSDLTATASQRELIEELRRSRGADSGA